ncbi:MAG TPA: carbon-nitrogen hydrolase family protein [Thermoplasmata archaeon]|nr:carbon-nitrogen hydrolase family protein [Thermoplasmata archaeon]
MVRVSLVQFPAALRDKEENIARISAITGDADADMVVFPETSLTGYSIRDETHTLAETLDGESVGRLHDIARDRGVTLVVGMPLRADVSGFVHNAAVVLPADGAPRAYLKHHLVNFGPFDERYYFIPGDGLLTFRTGGMAFGVTICYDIFFPEISKSYAMEGAEALLNISASPSVTRVFFERVLPARAIENTVYVLYTNLVRTEKELVFWGGAQALDPRGNLMERGPYYEEAVVTVDLDPAIVRTARPFRPTIPDTLRAWGDIPSGRRTDTVDGATVDTGLCMRGGPS